MKIIKLGKTRGTNWHVKIGRVGNQFWKEFENF